MQAIETADAIQSLGFLMGELRQRNSMLLSDNQELHATVRAYELEIGRRYAEVLGRNLSIDEWSALRQLILSRLPVDQWPPRRVVTVSPDAILAALYPFEPETFLVDVFRCTDPHYTGTIVHDGVEFNWIKDADPNRRTNAVNVKWVGTIDLALWTEEELNWLANSLSSLRNQTGADWIRRCLDNGRIPNLSRRRRRPIALASSGPVPTP